MIVANNRFVVRKTCLVAIKESGSRNAINVELIPLDERVTIFLDRMASAAADILIQYVLISVLQIHTVR